MATETIAKHTPGPWSVAETDRALVIRSAEGGNLADISFPDDVDRANAHVFAAALALLESLREMVADLISHATFGLNEHEVAMLKRAEAAIAKAEGR